MRDFDDFSKTTGKNEQTNPSSYLVELRELRDKIKKKRTTQVDFANVVTQYNSVVDMINGYVKFDELKQGLGSRERRPD